MTSGSKLDQIVKGAAPPGTSVPSVAPHTPSSAPLSFPDQVDVRTEPAVTAAHPDPVASLPSSPPQIYLNLLILEASLRSQYLTLRARRRQHSFFLLLLTAWIAGFSYALFLRPREDGSGVGGSVYWVVETAEKVALLGGLVTGILLWGTEASYHHVKSTAKALDGRQRHMGSGNLTTVEDLSPGGDYLKLLLLPKPFSPDFRENWELYRLEYWEKENERRAQLRRQVNDYQKQLAREERKWLWWTGWRRPRGAKTSNYYDFDPEKIHPIYTEKDRKRRSSILRTDSHSRNTSRSSTPASIDGEERPTSSRSRRGSSNHANSSERRKKLKAAGSADMANLAKITTQHSEQIPLDS
ncbi:MAG: hypothetical protein Q9212_001802 [Teloschistes hypoglaucus]